jgi:hypothetical protein
MYKIILCILLASFQVYANNVEVLIQELGLTKADVILEDTTIEGEDGPTGEILTSLRLTKPATFRGNHLIEGAQLSYSSISGLTALAGPTGDEIFKFDGAVCRGRVQFRKNKLCSCELAKPYKSPRGITIPEQSIIVFWEGHLSKFKVISGLPLQKDQDLENSKVTIGGQLIEPGQYYSVKSDHVEVFKGIKENGFCE